MRWFVETQHKTGLLVCRIKNKFLLHEDEVVDGYRDVTLNVLFEAENGLKIIGEIQVCDKCVRVRMRACVALSGMFVVRSCASRTHECLSRFVLYRTT